MSDRRTRGRRAPAPEALLADPEVADVVFSFLRLSPGPARRAAIRLVRALDPRAEERAG